MKTMYSFAGIILCILMTAVSCKKDIKSEVTTAAAQDFSVKSGYKNSWGIVISKSGTSRSESENLLNQYGLEPFNKIALSNNYGVQFYRASLVKEDWDRSKSGFLLTYDSYTANNLAVVLNLNWLDNKDPVTYQDIPQPFADNALNTNSVYYKWIKEVVDSLSKPTRIKPALIVVENEENNSFYHIVETESDFMKYINMLQAVINICKPKGIPVTNGGIIPKDLQLTAHDWLKNSQRRLADAQLYAWNAFMPSMYYTLYPPKPAGIGSEGIENLKFKVSRALFFLNKYKTMGVSCINFHWYEPTKAAGWKDDKNNGTAWDKGVNKNHTSINVLETTMEFMINYNAPKKIITNEIGVVTHSDCLVRELMTKVAAKPYGALDLACLYDGDGFNIYDAKAFHNSFPETSSPIYTLRPTGDMVSKFIKNQNTNSCTPE